MKISNLIKQQSNSMVDNYQQEIRSSLKNFEGLLFDAFHENKRKKVLYITFLEEYPDMPRLHYSKVKGYLLADGLKENGYVIFFATNRVESIRYDSGYYFVNIDRLNSNLLVEFDTIIFGLHNTEYIEPLMETSLIPSINKAKKKNPDLRVICKTCIFPIHLERATNTMHFFDKIILQTAVTPIPTLITKKYYSLNGSYTVESLSKHLIDSGEDNKFHFSNMTFPTPLPIGKSRNRDFMVDDKLINMVYIGRLNQEGGMNIIMLMKIMKMLGPGFKLYVIPGSFKKPDEFRSKKYSPKNNEENLKWLSRYFKNYKLVFGPKNLPSSWRDRDFIEKKEYNRVCNIETLPPTTYGEHFDIIAKMNIGLSFVEKRGMNIGAASTKLFDYMASNIRIVTEDGCENTYMVKDYGFGSILTNNATAEEFVDAILRVSKEKKSQEYDRFISEHNHVKRALDVINIIKSA